MAEKAEAVREFPGAAGVAETAEAVREFPGAAPTSGKLGVATWCGAIVRSCSTGSGLCQPCLFLLGE